jgi:hypothetical protein
MLVVVVLLATVVMRLAIIGVVVYLLLPRSSACPHCGEHMAAVRNRLVDWVLPGLERRWCLECGWDGIVRRRGKRGGGPDHSMVVMRRAARS